MFLLIISNKFKLYVIKKMDFYSNFLEENEFNRIIAYSIDEYKFEIEEKKKK